MASDDRDLKGDSFAIGHIVLDLREATRFGNNLQRYLLFILKKAELFIQDRSLQSLEWINLTDGLKLNGATSVPMSILRYLLDNSDLVLYCTSSDKLLGGMKPELNIFYLACVGMK